MCKSCDIDTSSFVSKFYGAFNSIMHVLGYKRNEMVAVQLARSYYLPSPLYGCEVWQTHAGDVRSASVAWNNCFRKIFNACWRESVRSLLFFCSCLPLTYIIHRRRLLYWKNCMFFDYVLLQTLARCCYDNIGSFAISINSLLRIFLIYRNNILLKNCSGKSMSGRIYCDSV